MHNTNVANYKLTSTKTMKKKTHMSEKELPDTRGLEF
jgi:hypothetical protein